MRVKERITDDDSFVGFRADRVRDLYPVASTGKDHRSHMAEETLIPLWIDWNGNGRA